MILKDYPVPHCIIQQPENNLFTVLVSTYVPDFRQFFDLVGKMADKRKENECFCRRKNSK